MKKIDSGVLERKPLTEYFSLNQAAVFFFTLAGLILATQMLTVAVVSFSAEARVVKDMLTGNSGAAWFCGILFALSAAVSWSASLLAFKKRDGYTWKAVSVFFLLLSCQSIVPLGKVLGWQYAGAGFSGANLWIPAAMWTAAALALGYYLKAAFEESVEAAKSLSFGAILFFVGAMADFYAAASLSPDRQDSLLAFSLIAMSGVRMLGAILLFSGLLLHEQFLQKQIQRLNSGRTPEGIPSAKTETAEWVLRMIGTPTRDEVLMKEEVSRRKQNEALAEKE